MSAYHWAMPSASGQRPSLLAYRQVAVPWVVPVVILATLYYATANVTLHAVGVASSRTPG